MKVPLSEIYLEDAKQENKDLAQAIEDAQSVKDYSDHAVKSVSAK